MTQAPSQEDRHRIQAQASVGFQDGSSRTCLLSWLIRGRDHHCVADGERNEEVKNVRQLGREVVQRVLLMPRGGQAPAALVHLLQQLGVWFVLGNAQLDGIHLQWWYKGLSASQACCLFPDVLAALCSPLSSLVGKGSLTVPLIIWCVSSAASAA